METFLIWITFVSLLIDNKSFFAAIFFLFIFSITSIEDTMKHNNNLMLCPNRSQHWTASSWWMQWPPGDPSTAAGIWKSQMTWPVIRWLEYIRIYAATQFPNKLPVLGTTCQFQSEAYIWASYVSKNELVHMLTQSDAFTILLHKKWLTFRCAICLYSILFSQGRK